MGRESDRAARLASLETRLHAIARMFPDLKSEAHEALHVLFRLDPSNTQASLLVIQSLATLFERMGLMEHTHTHADNMTSEARLHVFLRELPEDSRMAAAFQLSCLLLREVAEILLAISRETSNRETPKRLRELAGRVRPHPKKSGTYRIRKSLFPAPTDLPEEVQDFKARFSSFPPAIRTQTIEDLLDLVDDKKQTG